MFNLVLSEESSDHPYGRVTFSLIFVNLSSGVFYDKKLQMLLFMNIVTCFLPVPTNYNWASEASPTLGCSIEISRDISYSLCRVGTCGVTH